MRNGLGIVCILLILPLAGTNTIRGSGAETRAVIGELSRKGRALFAAGSYREAETLFRLAQQKAVSAKQTDLAASAAANYGSCRLSQYRYREALESYLEARRLGAVSGNLSVVCALSSNISALYFETGETDAAIAAAEEALRVAASLPHYRHKAALYLQLAKLRLAEGRVEEALRLAREGILEANRTQDAANQARGWDLIGGGYFERGELTLAEEAIRRSFDLRNKARLPNLDLSYHDLAQIRFAQRDLRAASEFLDQAVRIRGQITSFVPLIYHFHLRGQVRLAEGRLLQALEDVRKALELAARWRLDVLPSDYARVGFGVRLQHIRSTFLEISRRLYLATAQQKYAREAFVVWEQSRSAALQDMLREHGDWRRKLRAGYRETLARVHEAELAVLESENEATRKQLQIQRAALVAMEAEAAPGAVLPKAVPVESAQASLDESSAYLSLHLGDSGASLWALTRDRFDYYLLPPRGQIAEIGLKLRQAIQDDSPDARALGGSLYRLLFAPLHSQYLTKPVWRLALDQELFEIPLAAMVIGEGNQTRYLVERQALRFSPGFFLHPNRGEHKPSGRLFVGVGDPIYNTADPRYRPDLWARLRRPNATMQLPRLFGSSKEVKTSARVWSRQGGKSILMEGSEATTNRLRHILEKHPSVLHLATHFVTDRKRRYQGMIALSLTDRGGVDFLGVEQISRLNVSCDLVVLSSCRSGVARTLPGEGLMGMTRAWLAAGARSVLASYWPVPDDTGPLFEEFYERLPENSGAGAALALREAQRRMIGSNDWRRSPRYWAAYFVVGGR